MKDGHIIELLDSTPFSEIDSEQIALAESHAAHCEDCFAAIASARISSELLRVRAEAEKPLPSPFFQTKVLAAIRERQNLRKPIAAFRRWWLASYPLVGSMLFIVATFALLTYLAPRETPTQATGATYNLYTTDSVILNQKPPRSLTTEQALEVIYTERRDSTKR